ncbi:MAG: homoserine dehydrogenase [Candidatus Makaraimicrobium thalassicum]|nr:MAG: homoserine dehydrogenase [Candidatus Omnitrophota bacterium]
MKSVSVGLIGLGTIGKGVYDAIARNGRMIARRTGISLTVKGVCDKDKKALDSINDEKCPVKIKTAAAEDLVNDRDIDIIVELIGGLDPARDIILSALRNKKHVVTANKALLSSHWKEIFGTASENRVFVKFEASVGGAIPIIRTLRASLAADNIDVIYGILNGTTNFILSEMSENGCSFDRALGIAQEKGIAERDPELDISGRDSAHKLAILSLLGFGLDVSPEDIYTEGIADIAPQDIRNAARWGYSVKLLAIAKNTPEGLQLRVHPTLLPSSYLLSDVRGADNAIFVKGDLAGESLLFGKGAGRKPTSSSVTGDIVEIARHVAFAGKENPFPYNLNYASGDKSISRIEELSVSFYLRFSVIDEPGVLAGISSVLAENNISIANVSQEERREGETVPVIILTHRAEEGSMRKAIAVIDGLDYVSDKTVVLRIEE